MSSKTLCLLVRFATISTALCGCIILVFVLPSLGGALVGAIPELQGWYLPWLIFLWMVSLPCFVVLLLVWKVSGAVKRDEVFTHVTAGRIKTAAVLLFADVGFFLLGNILFILLNMSHPGVLLLSLLLDIIVIALALLASVLSRYITKAAVLQEESDGTI